jgi:hypothetical protein
MLRCALQQHPTRLHLLTGRCAIGQSQANPPSLQIHLRYIREVVSMKKAAEKAEDTVVGKRRASSTPQLNGSKKSKIPSSSSDPLRQPHDRAQEAEENGIVLRKFYPPEMSNAGAQAYNADQLPRPIELFDTALKETAN